MCYSSIEVNWIKSLLNVICQPLEIKYKDIYERHHGPYPAPSYNKIQPDHVM